MTYFLFVFTFQYLLDYWVYHGTFVEVLNEKFLDCKLLCGDYFDPLEPSVDVK